MSESATACDPVLSLLAVKAASEGVSDDACYFINFAEPNRLQLLYVPPGRRARLKQDMQQFVSELSRAIAAAFECDEYRARIEAINEEFKEREGAALPAC